MKLYLLRYGEIGTKSRNIRRNFEDILIQNIERFFLKEGEEVFINRERGRIFAHAEEDAAYLFRRVFGLVSFSPAVKSSSDVSEIIEEVLSLIQGWQGSFAVRCRRTGTHDFTSPEVAADVGEAVLEENPRLEVDLDDPDHEINIEIRNTDSYIFTEVYDCPGGLPLSSQGKLAAYVEDKYNFMATWLMMKRGARTYVYHPPSSDWGERLEKWDPNLRRFEKGKMEEMLNDDLPEEIEGIILGDRLEDHEKREHELPLFYPLIGFTEERVEGTLDEITELRKRKIAPE